MARYNGWANYETWVVNLWLTNEQGSYTYWQEVARETFGDVVENPSSAGSLSISEKSRLDLADRLKEEITDAQPETTGLWADLLGAALSEVDWFEVADGFLEECEATDVDGETVKYEPAPAVKDS